MQSRNYKPLPDTGRISKIGVNLPVRQGVKNQVSFEDANKLFKKKVCKSTEVYDCEWIDNGLPVPAREHRFHPTRKWKFDFAFVNAKVAIEIDGGAWINGRHNRGSGFTKDLEKKNTAQSMGWLVLNFVPKHIDFDMIKLCYDKRK
jgi:hypothetical protein